MTPPIPWAARAAISSPPFWASPPSRLKRVKVDGEDRAAWQPGPVTLVGGYLMGLRCLAHAAVVPVPVVASKMSSTARQLGIVPSPDGKRTIFV